MAEAQRPQDVGVVAERISQELATIHEESYGVRPRAVSTYLLPDAVLAVMEIDLLKHEQLIANNGNHSSIREIRTAFQEAIATTFRASIEHMTGRRVIAFVSDTHVDPPFALEFFKLGPAEEPGDGPADPDQG